MSTQQLPSVKTISAVALALCILAQPAVASGKNPVTRPLRVWGNLTMVVEPLSGVYVFTDYAEATHTGRTTNSGSGVIDLDTGIFLSGSGVAVAANGDTLSWQVRSFPTPNTIAYTGGTGRFEGVTGGFPGIITSVTLLSANPDGTLTLFFTYEGTGTITY